MPVKNPHLNLESIDRPLWAGRRLHAGPARRGAPGVSGGEAGEPAGETSVKCPLRRDEKPS